MNTRRRHLILATVILILVGFSFTAIFKSRASRDLNSGEERGKEFSSEFIASDARVVGTDIKSRSRIRPTIPTIEETEKLLDTVIPMVDLPPDRSVKETEEAINKLLQEAGIPPHQLKVTHLKSNPLLGDFRFRDELRIRNITVSNILKYVCDVTKVRYTIRPGVVIFLMHDDYFETEPPPPVEPKQAREELVDSHDPFSISPVEQADPFSEPSGR